MLGDALTVIARRSQPPRLCCAIQMPLRSIADDLYSLSVRIPEIHTAIFDVRVLPGALTPYPPVWRGAAAPPPPPGATRLQRPQIVHTIHSRHLGGSRRIYVDAPTDVANLSNLPVIYIADGGAPSFGGIAEALRQSGMIAPVVLVESAEGQGSPPPRNLEYLVGYPPGRPEDNRFEAHARFVAKEVIPWVEAHFPVSKRTQGRTTAGYSSGAGWAVAMAARHPELFGSAISMSLGWEPAAHEAQRFVGRRLFLGAGKLEPRFLSRTLLAHARAEVAGAEVRLMTPNAGHDFELYDIVFADALQWLFPPSYSH